MRTTISGPRSRRTAPAAVALVTLLAATGWIAAAAPAPQQSGDTEFPDGPGKKILEASCTSCHELDEVSKFKGYYTRAQWRDVVVTMVDYGAKVEPRDVDVLADYLDEHFGRK